MASSSRPFLLLLVMYLAVIQCLPVARPIVTRGHYGRGSDDGGPKGGHQRDFEDTLESGPYFEGDLAISPNMIAAYYRDFASIATAGIADLAQRWPDGKIYYHLDNSLSSKIRLQIAEAMKWWSESTCITFTPHTNQDSYVHIQSGNMGCYSNSIGRMGGKQVINLHQRGCSWVGTIAHELGHVLGLWHEQSRPDRDKYVHVMEENIRGGETVNFARRSWSEVDTQGLDYDFESVMHYTTKAFSRNGRDTMKVVDRKLFRAQGRPVIGQRDHLSEGDIAVINKLYNCHDKN